MDIDDQRDQLSRAISIAKRTSSGRDQPVRNEGHDKRPREKGRYYRSEDERRPPRHRSHQDRHDRRRSHRWSDDSSDEEDHRDDRYLRRRSPPSRYDSESTSSDYDEHSWSDDASSSNSSSIRPYRRRHSSEHHRRRRSYRGSDRRRQKRHRHHRSRSRDRSRSGSPDPRHIKVHSEKDSVVLLRSHGDRSRAVEVISSFNANGVSGLDPIAKWREYSKGQRVEHPATSYRFEVETVVKAACPTFSNKDNFANRLYASPVSSYTQLIIMLFPSSKSGYMSQKDIDTLSFCWKELLKCLIAIRASALGLKNDDQLLAEAWHFAVTEAVKNNLHHNKHYFDGVYSYALDHLQKKGKKVINTTSTSRQGSQNRRRGNSQSQKRESKSKPPEGKKNE